VIILKSVIPKNRKSNIAENKIRLKVKTSPDILEKGNTIEGN
jgi:hypothetical protein